jgi:hypothetical protein
VANGALLFQGESKLTNRVGRWKPGESGNPRGRTPGSGRVAELRRAIGEAVPEVITTLITQAKKGDTGAARLLLERVLPPIKATEQASPVELPDGSLADQGRAVLAAAGAGDLSTGQASQLMSGLASLAKLVETDELERRVAALENRNAKA